MLVDRYGSMVFQVVYRITDNREASEDLCQEAFIRAFRQLSQFKGDAAFSSWLYRIAWNLSMDHLDKARKQTWVDINELTETHNRSLPATEPFDTMDTAERRRRLTGKTKDQAPPNGCWMNLFYQEEKK